MTETIQLPYDLDDQQQELLNKVTNFSSAKVEAMKIIAASTISPKEAAACLYFIIADVHELSEDNKEQYFQEIKSVFGLTEPEYMTVQRQHENHVLAKYRRRFDH